MPRNQRVPTRGPRGCAAGNSHTFALSMIHDCADDHEVL